MLTVTVGGQHNGATSVDSIVALLTLGASFRTGGGTVAARLTFNAYSTASYPNQLLIDRSARQLVLLRASARDDRGHGQPHVRYHVQSLTLGRESWVEKTTIYCGEPS